MSDLERLKTEYARRERDQQATDPYSLLKPYNRYTHQRRQSAILDLLRPPFPPLASLRILELGCGAGGVLLELLAAGADPAHLHGVDLLDYRLAQAHQRLPHLPLALADGQKLPYPPAAFDLALQFTVFSSILDPAIKAALAAELTRILKPEGAILWYDFWLNPTNPHTRGIRPPEIRSLFPNARITLKRITLAPPIARRLVPLSWAFAHILENLKLFNTHYLALIRPL